MIEKLEGQELKPAVESEESAEPAARIEEGAGFY